jgi:hypothetical protein
MRLLTRKFKVHIYVGAYAYDVSPYLSAKSDAFKKMGNMQWSDLRKLLADKQSLSAPLAK